MISGFYFSYGRKGTFSEISLKMLDKEVSLVVCRAIFFYRKRGGISPLFWITLSDPVFSLRRRIF
jgi:hypothetical protein